MRIRSQLPEREPEETRLHIDRPELEFTEAHDLAVETARGKSADAMLLSWHSGKTGEFYPRFSCGGDERPPWIVFAEARGANLIVDINDGEFRFFFLLL